MEKEMLEYFQQLPHLVPYEESDNLFRLFCFHEEYKRRNVIYVNTEDREIKIYYQNALHFYYDYHMVQEFTCTYLKVLYKRINKG